MSPSATGPRSSRVQITAPPDHLRHLKSRIAPGEEVIRLVRDAETSPAPTVPIILMLSQPRKDRVERAVRLGVNEIIAKPF